MEKPKPRMFEMTEDEFRNIDNDCGGFCVACGEPAFGVEPDARRYRCEDCGKPAVFGAAELLLCGRIEIIDG